MSCLCTYTRQVRGLQISSKLALNPGFVLDVSQIDGAVYVLPLQPVGANLSKIREHRASICQLSQKSCVRSHPGAGRSRI